MIETIDPHESFYQVTGEPYEMRAMRRRDVMAVDYLIKVAGYRDDVKTLSDWGVVATILEFYSRQWPQEWSEYVNQIKDIKGSRARKDGYSREKGSEGTRYLAALPGGHFPKLFKIIFPNQQWDRDFTQKFIDNIQISRVGEKIDTWFTIPSAPSKRESIEDLIKKEDNKANGDTNRKSKLSGTRLVRNKVGDSGKRTS